MLYDETADDPCAVTSKIRDRYFNGEAVTADMVKEFSDLNDERMMTQCLRTAAEQFAKHNQVYLFNFTKVRYGSPVTPGHADELQYLFTTLAFGEILPSDPDYNFSKDMVSSWVAFARDG